MDAYRFLSGCGRLAVGFGRELFTALRILGSALIGAPVLPEILPPTAPRARRSTPSDGTTTDAASGRQAVAGEPGQSPSRVEPTPLRPGTEPGAPPAGHPERLIPHVPPTPVERRLWSQLR